MTINLRPADIPGSLAWSASDEQGHLGTFGFRLLPDNAAYAWALPTERLAQQPFAFHRAVKRLLPALIAELGFDVIMCDADISSPVEMEWLRRLGFEPVCLLRNAYGMGHDHMLFRMVVDAGP